MKRYFPTQVRVVRFYHSCSGPFFSIFSFSFSFSTASASTSRSTSALPTLRQSLRQLPRAVGTAGPQLPASDLSGHGWTSTARFWAQWALLDLSQGRWTSTWPDGMPEYMPERLPEYMPDRLPEYMPHRMPHRMPKYMRERMPHRMPEYMPDRTPK